jgi:AICAR transformylase/IMP cyclohydrolase PurH
MGLGIANPEIEQKALQKILRKQKNLVVLGFDTSFERKEFINKRISTSIEVESQLLLAFQQGKMNEVEARNYRRAVIVDSAFFEFVQDTTLERINKKILWTYPGNGISMKRIFCFPWQKHI